MTDTPALATFVDGELHLALTPVADGDRELLVIDGAVGTGDTFGALAYYLKPPGLALLFPHDALAKVQRFDATSIDDVIEQASTRFGQQLRR